MNQQNHGFGKTWIAETRLATSNLPAPRLLMSLDWTGSKDASCALPFETAQLTLPAAANNTTAASVVKKQTLRRDRTALLSSETTWRKSNDKEVYTHNSVGSHGCANVLFVGVNYCQDRSSPTRARWLAPEMSLYGSVIFRNRFVVCHASKLTELANKRRGSYANTSS